MSERTTYRGDRLDEVVVSGGAHLEHMDGDGWFLEMRRSDGSAIAIWFHGEVTLTEERPA